MTILEVIKEWAGLVVMLVAAAVGTGGGANYLLNLRKARIEKKQADAEATRATTEQKVAEFGANIELNRYIDARVDLLTKPMREELEELRATERTRTIAMTRILRAIANQWPAGHPGPHLDPADIAAVEDTIPSLFLKGSSSP